MTFNTAIKGFAIPLLLAATACKQPTNLEDHFVVEAWLEDVVMGSFAVLGGGSVGEADLHVVDADGSRAVYRVDLAGSEAGFALEFGSTIGMERVDLKLPTGVAGPDLLGAYTGLGWNVTIGIGADGHHLTNSHGVELNRTMMSAGVGLFIGTEKLVIKLLDDNDLCDGIDKSGDPDGDGVCTDIDPCPNDYNDDSDRDGVCDSRDLCQGEDDREDKDNDGIPNGCDLCKGDDLSGDPDGDGVCSNRDPCPQDPNDDSDGDGVCDGDDACAGGNDNRDEDGDGVPNGCDQCDGDDFSGDTDLDGICNDWDGCPDIFDDGSDSDSDGVPDACDLCWGENGYGDEDLDGVCADHDCDDLVSSITGDCKEYTDDPVDTGYSGGYSDGKASCSHTGGSAPLWLVLFSGAMIALRRRLSV